MRSTIERMQPAMDLTHSSSCAIWAAAILGHSPTSNYVKSSDTSIVSEFVEEEDSTSDGDPEGALGAWFRVSPVISCSTASAQASSELCVVIIQPESKGTCGSTHRRERDSTDLERHHNNKNTRPESEGQAGARVVGVRRPDPADSSREKSKPPARERSSTATNTKVPSLGCVWCPIRWCTFRPPEINVEGAPERPQSARSSVKPRLLSVLVNPQNL